ncbi:MAG: glycoside hydrolase family 38 C-terminal domain-containing protein, partial [Chloroflexota bacterium]
LRRSGTDDVLLGNGVDHEPVQRDLPEMLAACQARLPGITIQIGSFESYVDALKRGLGQLQVVEGELVGGREACVVRSVNSTRIYLKQANEATERALFVAEALASLAFLRNRHPYPHNELRLAWRELLRNHPHDSLPGCSLDEVHRDMEQRFRSARQIARQVQRESLASMAGQTAPLRPWEDRRDARSLVNVLPWARTGLVALELPEGLQRARSLVADTPEGPLPVQIEGTAHGRKALMAAELSGFGSRRIRLRAGRGPAPSGAARSPAPNTIENGHYRVAVADDGSLSVTDLRTGEVWSGLHRFQDEADRGDEYSFCPVEGDLPWDSRGLTARVRVLAAGPVVAEMEVTISARLPRALRSNRRARSGATVAYPVRTVIRLTAGIDRIEFRTTLENRAADHRLRVRFPAPRSDRWVRAEGHFAMLRRPVQPIWNGRWREPPTSTHHTLGVVAAGKLALMARGLPEYEAIPNPEGGVDLALTLLRCVGWLSWSDLATRPGAEDPHVPTPEAQCPGSHSFEYAISLRGEETDAHLVRAAQDYRVEMVDGPAGIELDGTLRVEGDGFGFSTLKGAEEGDGIILRLYNPARTPAVARPAGRCLTARRCRLDETAEEPEAVEAVPMRGGEIVTLMLGRRQDEDGQDTQDGQDRL